MSEDAALRPRRRHKRSWLRRNRARVFVAMMVVGGGLVCGAAVVMLNGRLG